MAGKLNTLSHIHNYVGQKTALLIYKTTILPIFEYSNIAHRLIPSQYRLEMQRLQNRALSIIVWLDRQLSTDELHYKANLNTLEQRSN